LDPYGLRQGDVGAAFTKWDYQPGSIHGVPDSFARALSIMMSERRARSHGLRLGNAGTPDEEEMALPNLK